ncbi:hypothetical protein, partial [Bifidobacterium sp. UBA744]|uniref:hypothetical protein n=1 Tax=Bifidobacterium sp. UBA744 TaxID=1946112 RepID=UPI0025BD7161
WLPQADKAMAATEARAAALTMRVDFIVFPFFLPSFLAKTGQERRYAPYPFLSATIRHHNDHF